ncbi:MAG: hypothetical protein AAGH79_04385 [Bacteroidota bacterium]
MKLSNLLLIALCSLTLTSCVDFLEELFMNKDGTGTYRFTIDVSALMDLDMNQLQEMMGQQGGEATPELDLPESMDSTINFASIAGEQLKSLERPEVFENAKMDIKMNKANKELIFALNLDFEDIADIAYFNENMGKIAGEGLEGMAGLGGLAGGANMLFTKKGKTITRESPGETPDIPMEGQEMEMLKMFLASATYKSVYHFPKKVKKTTMQGAFIDGNTLTLERSFLDVLEGNGKLDGTIKYK